MAMLTRYGGYTEEQVKQMSAAAKEDIMKGTVHPYQKVRTQLNICFSPTVFRLWLWLTVVWLGWTGLVDYSAETAIGWFPPSVLGISDRRQARLKDLSF